MSTSGTHNFNPAFAELLVEAFERCGIQPRDIVQDHITSALRSANLMLIDFGNRGVTQYQLTKVPLALTASDDEVELPDGAIDIWSAVLRRDGADTPVWPMGREAYEFIPKKTQTGRPFNYFVNRSETGLITRTVKLWPVPDRSTDVLEVWVWKFAEDQTKIGQNIPVTKEWFDAYAAGLSARLAEKYAVDRVERLEVKAEMAFTRAKGTDRERAPLRLRMMGYARGGRRR